MWSPQPLASASPIRDLCGLVIQWKGMSYGQRGTTVPIQLLPNRRGKEVQRGKFEWPGLHTQGSTYWQWPHEKVGCDLLLSSLLASVSLPGKREPEPSASRSLVTNPLQMAGKMTPLSLSSAVSLTTGRGEKERTDKEPPALKGTGKEATLASGHQLQPLAARAKSLPAGCSATYAWGPCVGKLFSLQASVSPMRKKLK